MSAAFWRSEERDEIETLIRQMNDDDWRIRQKALRKIVGKGKIAVEPLISVLKGSRSDLKASAAQALGKIRDLRAIPVLVACAKDPEWNVSEESVKALAEFGEKAVSFLMEIIPKEGVDMREKIYKLIVRIGSAAVPGLIKTLRQNDNDVRWRSIKALGQIGDAGAVPALIAVLKSRHMDDRWFVVEALGKIGGSEALLAVRDTLNDDNSLVRECAKKVLQTIQPKPPSS